jgi:hypothetical protein
VHVTDIDWYGVAEPETWKVKVWLVESAAGSIIKIRLPEAAPAAAQAIDATPILSAAATIATAFCSPGAYFTV